MPLKQRTLGRAAPSAGDEWAGEAAGSDIASECSGALAVAVAAAVGSRSFAGVRGQRRAPCALRRLRARWPPAPPVRRGPALCPARARPPPASARIVRCPACLRFAWPCSARARSAGPVVRAFLERPETLAPFDGVPLTLVGVADKLMDRVIAAGVPAELVTDAPAHLVADPDVDVVVELMAATSRPAPWSRRR